MTPPLPASSSPSLNKSSPTMLEIPSLNHLGTSIVPTLYNNSPLNNNSNNNSTSPRSQQPTLSSPLSSLASLSTTLTGLMATNSFLGHKSTIFAINYDEIRDQIISSGRDGLIIAWNRDGKVPMCTTWILYVPYVLRFADF